MTTEKPREFWIDDTCRGDSCQKTTCCVFDSETDECIHVIEHAAYQSLLEQAEKLITAINKTNWFDHVQGGYVVTDKDFARIQSALEQFRAFKKKARQRV